MSTTVVKVRNLYKYDFKTETVATTVAAATATVATSALAFDAASALDFAAMAAAACVASVSGEKYSVTFISSSFSSSTMGLTVREGFLVADLAAGTDYDDTVTAFLVVAATTSADATTAVAFFFF